MPPNNRGAIATALRRQHRPNDDGRLNCPIKFSEKLSPSLTPGLTTQRQATEQRETHRQMKPEANLEKRPENPLRTFSSVTSL